VVDSIAFVGAAVVDWLSSLGSLTIFACGPAAG